MNKRTFELVFTVAGVIVFTLLAWYGRTSGWLGTQWLWYLVVIGIGYAVKKLIYDPIRSRLKT
jgi:hypothetical protein